MSALVRRRALALLSATALAAAGYLAASPAASSAKGTCCWSVSTAATR